MIDRFFAALENTAALGAFFLWAAIVLTAVLVIALIYFSLREQAERLADRADDGMSQRKPGAAAPHTSWQATPGIFDAAKQPPYNPPRSRATREPIACRRLQQER